MWFGGPGGVEPYQKRMRGYYGHSALDNDWVPGFSVGLIRYLEVATPLPSSREVAEEGTGDPKIWFVPVQVYDVYHEYCKRIEEASEEAQCPEALDAGQAWWSIHVVSIPKTNENFRLLYDTKGRFRLHSVRDEEAKFKLCKVRSVQFGQKGIPYLNTYDGRTIRYPDPLIKANDTIKLDLETNKIVDFIKFDVGNVVMVTGGRNTGRVGVIKNREKHKGSFETIHVQDASGHEFATRMGNVFTIGKGTKPWVSLPKGKGIKLSIIEEARKRLAAAAGTTATA
ncbi:hypothetical protein B296_00053744 [Ensete ventricosum]|uniref:KOW domain-containing protein n=1 Tax=Ensete ventricosum TaxID=4639 RepID=A0A426XK54_ENSVE|nr:hypothetical protein B296_00053744 [Ensete ventricosum]